MAQTLAVLVTRDADVRCVVLDDVGVNPKRGNDTPWMSGECKGVMITRFAGIGTLWMAQPPYVRVVLW